MVPPCSDRIARVPPYSSLLLRFTCTGLSPTEARLSRRFHFSSQEHWPGPRSLAATNRVSVDVLSSGYLDVSVHRVCFYSPLYSEIDTFIDNQKSKIRISYACIKAQNISNLEVPVIEGGFPHSEIYGLTAVRTSP